MVKQLQQELVLIMDRHDTDQRFFEYLLACAQSYDRVTQFPSDSAPG